MAIKDKQVRTVGRVSGVQPQGEAGLLGLAASPTFAKDRLVFAYLSTSQDNRVVTMRYDGGRLGPPKPILTGIPNGFIHDGGRLLFARDGNLFVSTGETGNDQLAQDRDSLGGKILRITPQGDPAPGNPVKGSPVWTMGHRNVQGLAFDGDGQLWATEFGQDTWDELNRIDKARNYGWPLEEGRGDAKRFRNPFVQWRTDDASPSGLAYLDGSLWAGALEGGRLWQVPLKDGKPAKPRDFFVGDYGRMRTVVVAPDGNLWVTTSNRDGRGSPAAGRRQDPGDRAPLIVDKLDQRERSDPGGLSRSGPPHPMSRTCPLPRRVAACSWAGPPHQRGGRGDPRGGRGRSGHASGPTRARPSPPSAPGTT